jgi:hypothetical protein
MVAQEKASESTSTPSDPAAPAAKGQEANTIRRDIKGGIPYSTSPGVFKRALEMIITAERPDKFSSTYMDTILKLSGGSARTVPPLLKKMQFIGPDASPTVLYSKFKTDSGRSLAAYEGLKHSFGELFKRNEYIHKADENAVKDVIVEITGLKKTDPVVRLMFSTFDAIRGFISGDVQSSIEPTADASEHDDRSTDAASGNNRPTRLGLSYQINIVLPETENISVFNAIFRSLRDNLLR